MQVQRSKSFSIKCDKKYTTYYHIEYKGGSEVGEEHDEAQVDPDGVGDDLEQVDEGVVPMALKVDQIDPTPLGDLVQANNNNNNTIDIIRDPDHYLTKNGNSHNSTRVSASKAIHELGIPLRPPSAFANNNSTLPNSGTR